MEETGVPVENHRPAASHWQIDHIMLYPVDLAWVGFELTAVVIDTDCIVGYKSNYHTIMAMTALPLIMEIYTVINYDILYPEGFLILNCKLSEI